MIQLRKLHLLIGFILVPFLFVTAATGFTYLLAPRFYQLLKWHGWFKWGGLVLAAGLAFLAVSGSTVYINQRVQQARRKARAKAAATPLLPQ